MLLATVFYYVAALPQSKNRESKHSSIPASAGAVRGVALKDLLHAADLVSCMKVFDMEEVQQHLRHVFILTDDLLDEEN